MTMNTRIKSYSARCFAGACLLIMTACQLLPASAPLSYLSGHPDRPLPVHRYPLHIVAVDQQAYFKGPVQVTPGKHLVLLQLAHSNSHVPTQKLMALDVQACTRYYLVAKKESLMESHWEPLVFDTENVGGCDPQLEMQKATAKTAQLDAK